MIDSNHKLAIETTQPARERALEKPILAAIDIGTNSIHMAIVEIEPSLPAFKIIAREKDMVRLGDRDPQTGHLTPEASEL